MSTTTTNLGLVKPELTDAADITAMNQNWNIIDEHLHELDNHGHSPTSIGAADKDLGNVDNTRFRNKAQEAGVGVPIFEAVSIDGALYSVNAAGVRIVDGTKITIIPNMTSTTKEVTLGIGDIVTEGIRLDNGKDNGGVLPTTNSWLEDGVPVTLQYRAKYNVWIAEKSRPSASTIDGVVGVQNGGTGLSSIEEYNFLVGNGTKPLQEMTPNEVLNLIVSHTTQTGARIALGAQSQITSGSGEPSGGSDGDVYIQII